MKKSPVKKKTVFFCLSFIVFFAALMFYALKQNPNFNPSQLVGKKAPSFRAISTLGSKIDSSVLIGHGRWVVLNFWSTSCYVCRDEAPALQDFYLTVTKRSQADPFLVSVNIQDTLQAVEGWQKNYSQTFPVLLDKDGLISLDFGVTGTPETFFIDPDGIVRYRIAGEVNKATLLQFIAWLAAHPQATQSEATEGLLAVRKGLLEG